MSAIWSKADLADLRHHMRMLWIAFDPVNSANDNRYDDCVDEALQLCMAKKPLNEFIGFVDWVTYSQFKLNRTVDQDEANAHFAKKVYAWYRDCELLFGSAGADESSGPEAK
jgi:hypothetical protein